MQPLTLELLFRQWGRVMQHEQGSTWSSSSPAASSEKVSRRFPLIGWGTGLTMHYLFAVLWTRSETEGWQAKVEHRTREIYAS